MDLFKNALKLRDSLSSSDEISDESLFKVCFLHDIGKIGDGKQPQYIREEEDWRRNKGFFYQFNSDLMKMSISARSLWLINQYGIQLTPAEFQAILYHDGQYTLSGREVAHGEDPLLLIVHMADYWSAHIMHR